MLTNNNAWQNTAKTNDLSKAIAAEINMNAAKSNSAASKKANAYLTNVVLAKRYSIDDNGGGYRGL